MLCEWFKGLLLASLLGGLCAPVQANTTGAGISADIPQSIGATGPAGSSKSPVRIAQNDITISPDTIWRTAPVPPPVPVIPQKPLPIRIGLLLPLRSDALGQAANMVRAGFLAAYEREKDDSVSISVLETGDAMQDVLSGYKAAVRDHDIVVGPLSRSGVTAIAQSGAVSKPTIALAQPDMPGDVDIILPYKMMIMGLSVEEEARQVANWAYADKRVGKAFAISTGTSWQRRAAKAFSAQWQRLGGEPESMELGMSGGYFSANGLVELKKRIQADKPVILFVALDAAQARQVREAIGTEVMFYGTSQLNPLTLAEWGSAERISELNGVRLVDMPWQLQPDHTAVMVYPRLVVDADQRRNADLERLYALGIDAYRVAKEIASNQTKFEIDGVTGRLAVNFGKGAARFERTELPATYQDGMVVPVAGVR
jgi:outer membrane PBP1 activator LpoA protein